LKKKGDFSTGRSDDKKNMETNKFGYKKKISTGG
jgi:hypothetical protein